MKARTLLAGLLAGLGLVLLTGCPAQNCASDGCSTPASAISKITGNALNELNSADIQILLGIAEEFTGVKTPGLTEDEALAVVDLIRTLGITSLESIEPRIRAAQADPAFLERVDPHTIEVLMNLAGSGAAWTAAGAQVADNFNL